MPSISVIIITYNEEDKISNCLQSVLWADEIIVVDSNSTDKTREIAQKFTRNVYTIDWQGYGPQKNKALHFSSSEWVLSIDADEIVSDELRDEILDTLASSKFDGYKIPRLTQYCHKFLKHGGWWPDYTLRLFKRESTHFSDSQIHEKAIVNGKTFKLKNPILHYRSSSLHDTLSRMNNYSTIWAEENKHIRKGGVFIGFLHSAWSFFRTYIVRLGFLDGKEGFLMAISTSIGVFYKYTKLGYLNNEQPSS